MVKRTIPVVEALANPQVTLTPQALQALLDEVKASREALIQAKLDNDALRAKAEAAPAKADQSNKNLLKTIAVFKKAGYGVVVPHQDVKTFNLWIKEGLRPKEGEKSKPVNNLRLFHRSQCRPLTKAEAGEFAKKAKEREAKATTKSTATVVQINQPSA